MGTGKGKGRERERKGGGKGREKGNERESRHINPSLLPAPLPIRGLISCSVT